MSSNTARRCFEFCSLFEAEVLLRLMLERWEHPFAGDDDFRQELLETVTTVLEAAADASCTDMFIEGLPTQQMNFVAAAWYSERCSLQHDSRYQRSREEWLDAIGKSLPSCFCSTNDLGP